MTWLVPALGSLLLSGCLATNQELANPPIVAQPLAPIKQPVVASAVAGQTATLSKDEKLLVEKNRLNKYVNQQTPSQLRYSLQVLNQAAPDDGVYPTIEDLSTDEDNLRSQAERKKLEEELEALNR